MATVKRTPDQWERYVQDRSDEIWYDQEEYRLMVESWLKDWKLEAFDKGQIARGESEGKEFVTPNDPYNIIKLTERLLGGPLRIDVTPHDDAPASKDQAEQRELFLTGYYNRLQMERGVSLQRQLTWWAAVTGRIALDVKWIKEVLPEHLKDSRLPVMVRALDPRNVLVRESEFGWPLFAIHRYETLAYKVRERWKEGSKALPEPQYDDDQKVTVSDYWDDEYNVVVCEGKLLKKPSRHDYPRVPYIMAYADATPLTDERYRGLGILHAIHDLWIRKARIQSYIATGLLWYFWPAILVESVTGQLPQGLDITPGQTIPVPPGSKINVLQINPNVQLAEVMHTAVGQAIQDATYPKTLFGQEPSTQLAGFALSNLSSSAKGRIGPFKEPLEWALQQASELLLDLLQSRGGDSVEVWASSDKAPQGKLFSLKDANLKQHMPIRVQIIEQVPSDEQQLAVLGLQMIEKGVLSRQTYRDEFAPKMQHARREEQRVLYEMALMDESMQQKMVADAYQQVTGEKLPMPEPPPGQMPPGMPPQGGQPGQPPPGMMPQGGPPGGMPPQGPPQGPPPEQGGGVPPPEVLMQMLMGQIPPPPGKSSMDVLMALPVEILMAMAQGQIPLPPVVTMEMVQQALQMKMGQQGGGPPGMPPGGGPMPPQGGPPGAGPQGLPPGIGVPPQAMGAGQMQPPPGVNPQLYLGGGPNLPPINVPRP